MFWTSPHRNNVLFCYKFYPSCLFSPLPLLSIYLVFLYLVNNNNHPHFFNFSCRQSNSPPPIRRQPTWSRSSLVCMKYSVTKSSDYWGWSVLLLLIWRERWLGYYDQVRCGENTEGHQSAKQVWCTSIFFPLVPMHVHHFSKYESRFTPPSTTT